LVSAAAIAGLAAPQVSVQDTTIRGGSYAAVNFDRERLVTRASSDPTYVRRALMDFDITTSVPSGANVQSATLTLTVYGGGASATRDVGVFDLKRPFDAASATWDVADASTPWSAPGGDLGPQRAQAAVPNTAGSKVTFDLTALVQATRVSGGSRHARLALVDVGGLSDARAGYREYYGTESTDAATRPSLTIATGAAAPVATLPAFTRVFVIVMENKEATQIIGGTSAPYLNSLAAQYGLATNYTGVAHPSLPNYMALTGGQPVFTSNCIGCTTPARNIADQIEGSGRTWKAYMESMAAPCSTTDTTLYRQKHNPFVHYDDIVKNAARCKKHVVPFTQFTTDLKANALPNFVWITPNMCSDMHDCSIRTGDTWLSNLVPQILRSPAFSNAVLFVLWDEGTSSTGGGGVVPALVVSSSTPAGFRSSRAVNHYNVLRTVEDAWKLPALGRAASANALKEFFR
jgi:acid phosphatase